MVNNMDKLNIEEYIKDLSPELQEKARACRSVDELMRLAEENDIPVPDSAVEAIAGGTSKNDCPMGGEHDWECLGHDYFTTYFRCRKCHKGDVRQR